MTYLKLNILPAIACLAFFSQDVMAATTDVPDPFSQAVTAVRQKDYSTAYQLFLHLAEEGDYDAQYNLAVLFKKGLGHPTHYQNALKWAFLAELGGIGKATDMREELVGIMPEDTLELVRAEVKQVLTQRFEDQIFNRNQPVNAAKLVNDKRQMTSLQTHLMQQIQKPDGRGDKQSWAQKRLDRRHVTSLETGKNIFDMNKAGNIVQRLAIYRNAAMSDLRNLLG